MHSEKIKISIDSFIAVLILSLLYFFQKEQCAKNKELLFEKAKQKANEEIYSFMLKQQSTIEEGRL